MFAPGCLLKYKHWLKDLFIFNQIETTSAHDKGVFSTGAMGALAPAILKNRLLAPAIFGHFITVSQGQHPHTGMEKFY